jgi:hypothetical protein
MEKLTLKAEHVDSFMLMSAAPRRCDYKGCSARGRVRVFYRIGAGAEGQERAYVCVHHALELSNHILGKYKFGQEN